MPTVTVLMPVCNGALYLRDALESVLEQCGPSCEICVVDDGSKDDTAAILSSFSGCRLKILVNPETMGVAYSLNRGIKETTSDYIIRMDADDISLPGRIACQVDFMEQHPEIGISGAWIRHIGRYQGVLERRPTGVDCVKAFMMLDNPIVHPTVIMRRASLLQYSLEYDPAFSRSEDFDLWERASRCFPLDNLTRPVLKFRVHDNSVTEQHGSVMWQQTYEILRRGLQEIGLILSDDEIFFHRAAAHGELFASKNDLKKSTLWFQKLIDANRKTRIHSTDALKQAIGFVWFRLCRNNSQFGLASWRIYHSSNIKSWYHVCVPDRIKFFLAVLLHTFRRKSRNND